ncbi:MAG: hypothetical protein Q9220_001103 [cf. Caloplaca sp. 1 TL-2023]
MATTRSVDSSPQSYELIKRSHSAYQTPPRLVSFNRHYGDDDGDDDDSMRKRAPKLSPKPMPGRRKYRPFITATCITITTIISLAVLISFIKYMLPDTEWDGIQLDGTSCDLVNTQNSSRVQSAFQINLRGGAQLTFAEAKLVDLVFDLVVGQGGRLLLGAVSYMVFMDALLRSMEISPVSWKLYASLAFSSNSLTATWHATRAVFSTKGWRAKTYLIWCALAMIYVLAFPTLIESATGYVSPSSAGFNTNNGTVVTADSDDLLSCFDVFGGALIGLSNHTQAKGPPAHVFDAVEYPSYGYGDHGDNDISPPGFDNTTLYYTLLNNNAERIFDATNTTLPPRYNSTTDQYQGGFSYTTNITINDRNELVRSGRTIRGPFRAAADLVEAMNETLGHQYCAYSEQEIEKALQNSGESLKYDSLLREGSDVLHVGLSTDKAARVLMSRKRLYGRKSGARSIEET